MDALDEEFPQLAAAPATGPAARRPATTGGPPSICTACCKATETLSGEVVLDRLLEKLIAVCLEVAGARRGALVLAQDSGGAAAAGARPGRGGGAGRPERTRWASPGRPAPWWSTCSPSGEAVVLADAARHGASPPILLRGAA